MPHVHVHVTWVNLDEVEVEDDAVRIFFAETQVALPEENN
jgi:hypothetical protein